MNNLSIQPLDIDLPLRVVSYREPGKQEFHGQAFGEQSDLKEYEILKRPSSTPRLLREPRPRYDRRKSAIDPVESVEEAKPYPFHKDMLWKIAVEDIPEDFLQFFFPEVAAGRDLSQKIQFLNTEQLQLFRPTDGEFAPRRVDILMKVPMLKGKPLIVHCEIQGSRDRAFSLRMFRYYYRSFDKYPGQVTAIAILTDGERGFRPEPYRDGAGPVNARGLCYDFEIYKVLDRSEEELERSDSAFALVILATKAALKRTNGEYTEGEYFRRKRELFNWIKERRLSEIREQALLSFLLDYQPLKDETLKRRFDEQLRERSKTMGTRDYLINKGREEGIEEGWKAGRLEAERSKDLAFVRSLITNTGHGVEKIADLAAVDMAFVRKVQAEMRMI